MTFEDRQLNSMIFQALKMKFLNSTTFQVFHDLYEPCWLLGNSLLLNRRDWVELAFVKTSGMVTRDVQVSHWPIFPLSLATDPEVFANVTSVQFPSNNFSNFLSVANVLLEAQATMMAAITRTSKNNNNNNNNSAHASNFSTDIPERGPQVRCCNPENQQTAAPVHFYHNPKR